MTTMLTPPPLLDRRAFLADLGRGAFAIAVMGVAACAPSSGPSGGGRASSAPAGSAGGSGAPSSSGGSASPGLTPPSSPGGSGPGGSGSGAGVAWTRVNLGFVSAYILARGGEAAVVDTGVAGSGDAIEAALRGAGLDWPAVGHVILTHRHADHAGSAEDVLTRAGSATGYAGAADIPAITVPRTLQAVRDGESVFGLTVVATPGHTAGHISVLDPVGGILVAGDALNTQSGSVGGSPPQFTEDMTQARASVARLAALTFETLLVGHGEPIEREASARVREFAAAAG